MKRFAAATMPRPRARLLILPATSAHSVTSSTRRTPDTTTAVRTTAAGAFASAGGNADPDLLVTGAVGNEGEAFTVGIGYETTSSAEANISPVAARMPAALRRLHALGGRPRT